MKKWYTSKTLIVNLLAIIGLLVHHYTGKDIISIELQTLLLPVLNVILRAITKEKIEWR